MHLGRLFPEVPWHLLEHILEHRVEALLEAIGENAVLLGFLLRGANELGDLLVHRRVTFLVPDAERDDMLLEPGDRIAQRPFHALVGRAVFAWVVRSGVALRAIGEMF